MNLDKVKSWANDTADVNITDEILFIDNNSKDLIICAGDSWTWGDSLTDRTTQIYGKLLSDARQTDLLNIGFCGWSNSWILNFVAALFETNKNDLEKYHNVSVVLTLTENARDIKAPHSFRYNYLEVYNKLGNTEEFYSQVLSDMENNWVSMINQLCKCKFINQIIVTCNFVWHEKVFSKLNSKCTVTELNWIESIAKHAGYNMPIRTNMATGWIFDEFSAINDICDIEKLDNYKQFVLPYIEKANLVNQWLDNSKYNGKKASKHPDYRGHKIWADYLITYLEKNHEMV